jgi:hypothetical protein
MDEGYEILFLIISPNILFHVDTCKTPNDIWTKLKDLLGKKVEGFSRKERQSKRSSTGECVGQLVVIYVKPWSVRDTTEL